MESITSLSETVNQGDIHSGLYFYSLTGIKVEPVNSQQKFILVVSALIALFLFAVLLNRELSERTIPTTPTVVPTTPSPTDTPKPVRTRGREPSPSPESTSVPATQTPTTADLQIEFFVAPDGSENGDGSEGQPWSMQHALSHPKAVKPGDTIWVRGGVYEGQFVLELNGEKNKPITVRAYPGERAILTYDDRVMDIASSSYVNLWGLEITATKNERNAVDRKRTAYGVRINQGQDSHDINFINMIVHDVAAQGFGWWASNTDSEIYGSIIFYNGSHNQFDHGIYLNNINGQKRVVDNIIFDNASFGIHAYGNDEQPLNNIYVEGNTVFNNGTIGYSTSRGAFGVNLRNIIVGGLLVAENPVIKDNYTYITDFDGESLDLGYQAGSRNAVVEDNYFAGGQIKLGGDNSDFSMTDNTILGVGIASALGVPSTGNNWVEYRPGDLKIFVRPNKYEAGRANITIYNWQQSDTVALTASDLAGVDLQSGDQYELRNVQDYFTDVITGTYDGEKIEVPMTGHTVAQPLGLNFKPPSTFPEFGAFVLQVSERQGE